MVLISSERRNETSKETERCRSEIHTICIKTNTDVEINFVKKRQKATPPQCGVHMCPASEEREKSKWQC